MGERTKQRNLNRRISKGQKSLMEMLNMISHHRNENQNNSEILYYTCENKKDQKH